MPTLDDVYRKFGEVAEAAQLLETELGNMLLITTGVAEGLLTNPNPKQASDLLDGINRNTLGQLLMRLNRTQSLDKLDVLLSGALEERNRLSHSFYRQHNVRRNSDEGRTQMLEDLESIHDTLIAAYKAVMLLNGTDLEALVEESSKRRENGESAGVDDMPTRHLPI